MRGESATLCDLEPWFCVLVHKNTEHHESARSRHSTLISLGEPPKHNALLVEYALEPCLEGGVAPSLLDVLHTTSRQLPQCCNRR